MAKLVYALNMSLDGFVDHDRFAPDAVLFRHFIDDVAGLAGAIYGRRMYEVMRYWDSDDAEWGEDEWAYARAWRKMRKWVVSTTLDTVGPNAELINADVAAAIQSLKEQKAGTIEIAGPELADSMKALVDEYHLYVHPVVLGQGKPLFAGPPPPLRLVAHERIGAEAVRLTYAAA